MTDLLEGYGLQQLVHVPIRGKHTLDIVITRTEEDPVSNIRVTYPLLSDHKVVTVTSPCAHTGSRLTRNVLNYPKRR